MKNNLQVLAPLSGQVLALECVPDPVFSEHMVGSGLAIRPDAVCANSTNYAESVEAGSSTKSVGSASSTDSTDSADFADSDNFAESTNGTSCVADCVTNCVTVVSPISGQVTVLWPHAFVVKNGEISLLVHLGLNTVKLQGRPFELLVAKGARVRAGEAIVRWNIAQTMQAQIDCTVAITVPEPANIRISDLANGRVQAKESLFWVASS